MFKTEAEKKSVSGSVLSSCSTPPQYVSRACRGHLSMKGHHLVCIWYITSVSFQLNEFDPDKTVNICCFFLYFRQLPLWKTSSSFQVVLALKTFKYLLLQLEREILVTESVRDLHHNRGNGNWPHIIWKVWRNSNQILFWNRWKW